jgi:oxygen-independent coproporphyrinogen-3 oxidase
VSGIYVHIPFCKQACHYCDFHFSTSLKNKEKLVDALCTELLLRKDYLNKKEVSTVYFGGGTPSLLSKNELEKIIDSLHNYFSITPNAEITIEANPDDFSLEKLSELKGLGFNRLSIGIQSFFDEHLKKMNRSHTAGQAIDAVKMAQNMGFKNISVDLIYGLPDLSADKWLQNLKKVFELNIQHLSAYNLTVEKKTALAHLVKNNEIKLPAEEEVIHQFNTLIEQAKEHGFIHYEISNFCKDGMHSRHNSNYWKSENYLGIGPSAHSYNGLSREWNISNNTSYVQNIKENHPWYEIEILKEEDKYNEYIMTRLRTIWGIETSFIKNNFGQDKLQTLLSQSQPYISSGHIRFDKETIILTASGKLLADKIASDLFI